jgi:Na+-transporting NADH:ubiquinone oxidoreductase subunit NqrF
LAHELTHVVQQNPDKVQTKPDDDGVQTSCACGGGASGLQMKLSVSAPGDQYEQEADRIASAVMHQETQSSAGSSQAQSINRQMPEEEEEMMQAKYRDDKIRRQVKDEEEKPV